MQNEILSEQDEALYQRSETLKRAIIDLHRAKGVDNEHTAALTERVKILTDGLSQKAIGGALIKAQASILMEAVEEGEIDFDDAANAFHDLLVI